MHISVDTTTVFLLKQQMKHNKHFYMIYLYLLYKNESTN